MLHFSTIKDLKVNLNSFRRNKKRIGFVPTMGALHAGHLSLIKKAKKESDIVVCSIFVNPTQFNEKDDFKNYPRTLDSDMQMLESENCDVLFCPDENEIYNYRKTDTSIYNFGYLETCMEGLYRPGHFKGVAYIVHLLFNIVEPYNAYFGEKDFQQLVIIKNLVKQFNLPIKIIPCSTVRESDGLAMSSRNIRLNSDERKAASLISKTLIEAKKKVNKLDVGNVKKFVIDRFKDHSLIKVQYFDIVNSESLQSVTSWNNDIKIIGCIALFAGKVRLIDNIFF